MNSSLSLLTRGFNPLLLHVNAGMPLKSLDLSFRNVTDAGLAHLIEAPLQSLYLRGCNRITDGGVQSLIHGKPLTALDLRECLLVSDEILPDLADLPLVKLSLSGESLYDFGLAGLFGDGSP